MEHLQIGQRIKAVRQSKGMTLEDTAALTGVSKPMLGQIERGQSSPTVNTLWKIATGLKIPFSSLLQEQEAEYTIANVQGQQAVEEENGAMRVYTLFPFDPVRSFEAFYIEFDAGCRHRSPSHNHGVEECVFVVQGKLDLILNGETVSLSEKQVVRFAADIPHTYCNPNQAPCSVYDIIFYRT